MEIYILTAYFFESQHNVHIHRWDAKELDELPEYMKICFNALQDVTDEIAYEVGGEKNFNMVLQCLKKTVLMLIKLCC